MYECVVVREVRAAERSEAKSLSVSLYLFTVVQEQHSQHDITQTQADPTPTISSIKSACGRIGTLTLLYLVLLLLINLHPDYPSR